ncbi:hypothetical protein [Flavobacterium granuli]|uniref:Outer membrane protein beta-barrel domain-containing protein n=1 Tax=Flavobacterium granuli TaxID=280093 RepID=A0ABU1S685_9FLAO|nr:hypothetical protein [Flavobacterium granuli]MDR6846533.1 hypothetical protein [Flavobacterium granuli]
MKNKEAKSIFSSLENYSSIPPPELWDKIEAQLDEPKKKKRAIIWWSIAASLVVGLSVPTILYFNANQGNGLELNVENNANGVVLQKDSKGKNNSNKNDLKGNNNLNGEEVKNDNLNSNQVTITTVSSISSKAKDSSKFNNLNQWRKKGKIQIAKNESQSSAIASNQNATSVIPKSESPIDKSNRVGNSNSIVSNQKSDISEANKNKGIAENTIPKSEIVIGKSAEVNQSNASNKSIGSNQNKAVSGSNSNKGIAGNTILKSELSIDKSVQANQSNGNNKSIVNNQNNDVSRLSSNKVIAENANSKDSLNKIKSEVEQLEKALVQLDKDKTKKKTTSENIDKWSLQVFAGVMSSQNYSNEKALGNTVASKESNGYGVKTNYKLNKKWGISSGFKINELGQKIAGVSYYEQQSRSGILSNTLPIASDIYQPSSSKKNYEVVFISNNQDYMFASNPNADNGFEKGDVTQNLKYFEVPLEVSYAILSKKKANISMNTGGFVGKLISNDIALNGSSIGENKNVNEFVYGTLLSSTLEYEVFKKTNFFIEPGMNYYINPLENQSFNQFQWMFNVGLNVTF